MLVLWLLTTVVSLSISPVLNAQNRPPRGSATQQKTEENVERGTNTGVRVEDMKVLIDNAIANKQIVSGLKAKILRKQILFDVTLAPNEAEEPWMILLNLTDEKFAEANQEYTAQGYRIVVNDTIVANRKTLHSVVWVRNAPSQEATPLKAADWLCTHDRTRSQGFEPLDQLLTGFLQDTTSRCATVAVSKDGVIVYERGFGYAEIDPVGEMQPQAEMRIASISKPITGVAVLQLVEAGRLSLDAKVVDLLKHPEGPAYPAPVDVRWNQITVRTCCITVAAGIVDVSKDPMFQVAQITQKKRLRHTANAFDIIRFQLEQPLDFEPGTRSAYSNFGYSILGRIIEEVTGQKYDEYVRNAILDPAGMVQTRLGKTRLSDRGKAEVRYFVQKSSRHPHSGNPSLELRGKLCPRLWMHPTVSGISKSWMLMAAGSPLQVTSSAFWQPGTDRQTTAESRKPTVAAGSTTVRRRCRQRLVWLRFQRTNNGRRRCQLLAQRRTSGTSTLLVRRSDGYSGPSCLTQTKHPPKNAAPI